MRVTRILNAEQELVARFIGILGRGLAVAGRSKAARPGFFLYAATFIHEYVEPRYFPKEDVLLQALVDAGFPPADGPVGAMRTERTKSCDASRLLGEAARAWQGGEEVGRAEVIWATSEYTGLLRHHLERLKNLIYPLLEQSVNEEGERAVAEALNQLAFADRDAKPPEAYRQIVDMLEEELKDWEG